MTKIIELIKKYWLYPLGAVVGGILGYVYWINWACDSGCLITASPTRTVIYFAVMGALLFSIFAKKTN